MSETARGVEVVRVGAEHATVLAEFYRQVWDPEATAERVRESRARAAALNPVAPGEPPPTWLVLRHGQAIAHVTTIPVVLWMRDQEQPAHWIKGLWVLPEHQRSAAGFLVLRAAAESIRPALALVHEPAARRLFEALGFTDLGSLPNELRILRARRVLERLDFEELGLAGIPPWARVGLWGARAGAGLIGLLADAAVTAWTTLATGPLGRFALSITPDLERDAAETLWRAVRHEVQAGQSRGAAYLAERYVDHGSYLFVHVRSAHRLAALAVVKAPRDDGDPRLGGIRIATVSDLLYSVSEPRTGLAALRGAEVAARHLGADAVLNATSPAALRSLARRRGYVRLPATLHVLARFPADGPQPPTSLDDWWVTRGDSGGDGTF